MNDLIAAKLNNHSVFKGLANNLPQDKVKCMNLITCKNDILYIWNCVDRCIDTVNIKLILKEADLTNYISIKPNPSLFFTVERLTVNPTSTILAVWGPGGIAILKLPDRWPLKEKQIEIPSQWLAQSLFLSDHHTIREVKWHPGSPTDSFLLMLTSDECLRLYNALDETLIWKCSLSNNHAIRRSIPSKASLGETPVDFDFGLPERTEDKDVIKWPVFIVWGNADVYSLLTNLEEDSNWMELQGPFRLLPSADDNYGSDASSVAVMDTVPPLIVVATCNGSLYHSILLTDDSQGEKSKVLHVVERIELELGITLGTEVSDDVISCPVRLEKDVFEASRYFCIHSAGMHCFTLPIVPKLIEFSNGDGLDFPAFNVPSFAEYLLCTAITSGSELTASPMLGVAYVDMTKLLVLLSSGKLLSIPLIHHSERPIVEFKPNMNTVKMNEDEPFYHFIQNILKEKGVTSCPMMKIPGDATRPQDWLEIVRKATQSYRAVLQAHSEIALKIHQRSETLRSTVKKQLSRLGELHVQKNALRTSAEQIAEKYEELNEKLPDLMDRAQQLLLRVDCNADRTLTTSEKRMAVSLERAKTRLEELGRDHEAVKAYLNQMEAVKPSEEKDIALGDKAPLIYKHIKHLNSEVSILSNRVKASQKIISQYQVLDL